MGLEAEGEVDARALALGALERGAGATAERAHGLGLAGAAHGHHALSQGPVEVPAEHLRLQRAAGGAAVALGERPMDRGAGPRDGHGRRVGVGLSRPAAAAAPAHGNRPLPSHLDLPRRSWICCFFFFFETGWICCWSDRSRFTSDQHPVPPVSGHPAHELAQRLTAGQPNGFPCSEKKANLPPNSQNKKN